MIHLKLDNVLKEQLRKEAAEKGLPLATYIRLILIERGK